MSVAVRILKNVTNSRSYKHVHNFANCFTPKGPIVNYVTGGGRGGAVVSEKMEK